MEKIKIGIIGIGMTGAPMKRWFGEIKHKKRGKDLFCFDSDLTKRCRDDISQADIIWLCLPTPSNPDGSCNISIIEKVVSELPDGERLIVIKSTIPPLTLRNLQEKYKSKGLFFSNPEFLTESQAWEDFIRPDRQIVAAANEEGRKFTSLILGLLPIGSFQSPGVIGTYKFHEANSTEVELAKYGGNAFGAVKVDFANIIADFCSILGANQEVVLQLIGFDRRIGHSWMNIFHGKYRGFGGFCFIKDLNALIKLGEELLKQLETRGDERKEIFAADLNVLKAVRISNETRLKSQGLTVDDVCSHDKEVEKIVTERRK